MIIGHKKQNELLNHFFEKGNIPHAFVFHGPEKIGKRKVATDFIRKINCLDDINLQRHPDLLFVVAEKNEIYMEQIEEVIKKVSLKSSILPFKGIVIDEAHLMNTESQNSLLKTLEEPSGDTVIILVTEYPFLLLPTIISRSFKIGFNFVEEEEIFSFLQKQGCKESKEITSLSLGRPGVAVDCLGDKEKKKEEEVRRKEFNDILQGSLSFRFSKAKELSKREDLSDVIKCWLECLRFKLKKDSDIKLKGVIEDLEDAILFNRKTNTNIQLLLEKIMIKL